MIKPYGNTPVFQDFTPSDFGILPLTFNLIAPKFDIHPFYVNIVSDDDIDKLRFFLNLKHIINEQLSLLLSQSISIYHEKSIKTEDYYGYETTKTILEEDIGIFSQEGLLYPPMPLLVQMIISKIPLLFTIIHYPILLKKIKDCVNNQRNEECKDDDSPCWEAIDGECPSYQFRYFFNHCSNKLNFQDIIDAFKNKLSSNIINNPTVSYDVILNTLNKVNYFDYLQNEYQDAFTKIVLYSGFSCDMLQFGECSAGAHFCKPIDFTNYFENRFREYLSLLRYFIYVSHEYINTFGKFDRLSLLSDIEPFNQLEVVSNTDINRMPMINFYTIFSKLQPINCETKNLLFK